MKFMATSAVFCESFVIGHFELYKLSLFLQYPPPYPQPTYGANDKKNVWVDWQKPSAGDRMVLFTNLYVKHLQGRTRFHHFIATSFLSAMDNCAAQHREHVMRSEHSSYDILWHCSSVSWTTYMNCTHSKFFFLCNINYAQTYGQNHKKTWGQQWKWNV